MAKRIMIQGTMSNVGKSVLTTGLCRIFAQDGYKVAPFKSQNMALNSYITESGLEMGRAQAIQAEAANITPSAAMNPILLKPGGDGGSQVVLEGKTLGEMDSLDYNKYKAQLPELILKNFRQLEQQAEIIVIEGAGSAAELNLLANDIVNMGLAQLVDAPVILVGDIERGGVFASLYGTIQLLPPEHQARIKGTIVNKFRGKLEIFQPGIQLLEEITGRPVLGVVPSFPHDLEDEDSIAPRLSHRTGGTQVDLGIIHLPGMTNFTDYYPLGQIPELGIRYPKDARELGRPDLIILPDTQQPEQDLLWLRENGMEGQIQQLCQSGVPVMGFGRGYQMLGKQLGDLPGLGLLPLASHKRTTPLIQRKEGVIVGGEGIFASLSGAALAGYQILAYDSELLDPSAGLVRLPGGDIQGASCGSAWGIPFQGVFDRSEFFQLFGELVLGTKGITRPMIYKSYQDYKNQQYDQLADLLREYLDIPQIYRIMEAGNR